MQSATVVVVEDDDPIAELLGLYLGRAGFDVARATTGAGGIDLVSERRPVLVVVDIGLPGGVDGLEVCRRLRAEGDVPILVLTARGDEADRIRGFELGADDYVTKPFSPRELVARVSAIVRRSASAGAGDGGGPVGTAAVTGRTVVVGDVEVDLARHEARRHGAPVPLAPREFALLAAFVENRGLVLSRRQLLDLAWGWDFYGDERTVDVHVRQLRRKLGNGLPLVTLRRTGYRLG
ncbi:MAG TPA: response regulator transcription factor [Acidimicrobiales bacterium]|nr:response regulator transcription factor [Acidimicrobiales bacterium]